MASYMISFKWDDTKALKIAKEEFLEEGEAKGTRKTIIRVALSLLKKKYPISAVIDATDLTADEVREIAKKNGFVV